MQKIKIKIDISINRVIQVLLLFLFVSSVANGLFAPFFAVFVVKAILGATIKTVGFSIAIGAVVKSVLQVPLARRIDTKPGEKDDFYVMLVGSVTGILFPAGLVFTSSVSQLYLLSLLGGVSSACLMAAYYSMFSNHVDRNARGFEWSLFSAFGLTLSVAFGGAIGGVFADAFGFANTFIISAILNFIATLLLVLLYPLLEGSKKKTPIKMPMP